MDEQNLVIAAARWTESHCPKRPRPRAASAGGKAAARPTQTAEEQSNSVQKFSQRILSESTGRVRRKEGPSKSLIINNL